MAIQERQRARRGTGTYRTLQSGLILHQFALGVDEAGRRVRGSVTGRTEAECREKAAKRLAQGPLVDAGETVAAYLERWVQTVSVRESSRVSYAAKIQSWIIPGIGRRKKLVELTYHDVVQMMRALTDRGLSTISANYARTVLGIALKDALRDHEHTGVTVNAASLAKGLRGQSPEVVPLTAEQVEQVLTHVRGSRWWPYYLMSVSTGLRPNELLALRWADVTADTIHVMHSLHRTRGRYWLEIPKSNKTRDLPVDGLVRQALAAQRTNQQAEREAAGRGWIELPEDFIFRTRQGRAVELGSLGIQFHRDLAAAGVRDAKYKDLRHTYATQLLLIGTPLEVVSALLGHANITITAQVYAKVLAQLKARHVAGLPAAWGAAPREVGKQVG